MSFLPTKIKFRTGKIDLLPANMDFGMSKIDLLPANMVFRTGTHPLLPTMNGLGTSNIHLLPTNIDFRTKTMELLTKKMKLRRGKWGFRTDRRKLIFYRKKETFRKLICQINQTELEYLGFHKQLQK